MVTDHETTWKQRLLPLDEVFREKSTKENEKVADWIPLSALPRQN